LLQVLLAIGYVIVCKFDPVVLVWVRSVEGDLRVRDGGDPTAMNLRNRQSHAFNSRAV
jgi:hypothetical protein